MGKINDLTGQKFGRLTAIEFVSSKKNVWLFKCDCGKEVTRPSYGVIKGDTRSCGCLRSEEVAKKNFKHGHGKKGEESRAYVIWQAMKYRCYNPHAIGYANYGGRGIKVCERWLESFENFLADMGDCPADQSIDRIDVNGDYCPENCRWATVEEQTNNTRRTIRVVYEDAKYSLKQLCEHLNLKYRYIYWRYYCGAKIEDLIPGARLL